MSATASRILALFRRVPNDRRAVSDSIPTHDASHTHNLVQECVDLFNMLERSRAGFDEPQSELAELVQAQIQEMLERSGVQTIWGDREFSPLRHTPEHPNQLPRRGAVVMETVSPGFEIDGHVLRKARVRLR